MIQEDELTHEQQQQKNLKKAIKNWSHSRTHELNHCFEVKIKPKKKQKNQKYSWDRIQYLTMEGKVITALQKKFEYLTIRASNRIKQKDLSLELLMGSGNNSKCSKPTKSNRFIPCLRFRYRNEETKNFDVDKELFPFENANNSRVPIPQVSNMMTKINWNEPHRGAFVVPCEFIHTAIDHWVALPPSMICDTITEVHMEHHKAPIRPRATIDHGFRLKKYELFYDEKTTKIPTNGVNQLLRNALIQHLQDGTLASLQFILGIDYNKIPRIDVFPFTPIISVSALKTVPKGKDIKEITEVIRKADRSLVNKAIGENMIFLNPDWTEVVKKDESIPNQPSLEFPTMYLEFMQGCPPLCPD